MKRPRESGLNRPCETKTEIRPAAAEALRLMRGVLI
nr:MAG TPA: hypothetical protein [Caudoviricetes sp.]